MSLRVSLTTTYNTSLERAFKTPFLCDISKVHSGFLTMPRITHCLNSEHWGQPGDTKRACTTPSFLFKNGEVLTDTILERRENAYWKIRVDDFSVWAMGFTHFEGEWQTRELSQGTIEVVYTYTLIGGPRWLLPAQWLFAQTMWRAYMHHILENIRKMIAGNEPYQYN